MVIFGDRNYFIIEDDNIMNIEIEYETVHQEYMGHQVHDYLISHENYPIIDTTKEE